MKGYAGWERKLLNSHDGIFLPSSCSLRRLGMDMHLNMSGKTVGYFPDKQAQRRLYLPVWYRSLGLHSWKMYINQARIQDSEGGGGGSYRNLG